MPFVLRDVAELAVAARANDQFDALGEHAPEQALARFVDAGGVAKVEAYAFAGLTLQAPETFQIVDPFPAQLSVDSQCQGAVYRIGVDRWHFYASPQSSLKDYLVKTGPVRESGALFEVTEITDRLGSSGYK